MEQDEPKSTIASYLPPPAPHTISPQAKKQRLNLPSPVHTRSTHSHVHSPNNNNSHSHGPKTPTNSKPILPPPAKPPTPSSMDMHAMDIRIKRERLDSLDALVLDQIADHSTDDEDHHDFHDDPDVDDILMNDNMPFTANHHRTTAQAAKSQTKSSGDETTHSIDNDKLIALVNGGSGARKGWILSQELQKLDASVFDLRALNKQEAVREQLGFALYKHANKCIVLICGGDGSQAWAASLIDKSLDVVYRKHGIKLRFPPTCVFPMGTGNDLSRSLGWGTMEPNHKNLVQYIADIHFCAKITKRWSDLDRWRVTYTFDDVHESKQIDVSMPPLEDDELDGATIRNILEHMEQPGDGDTADGDTKAKRMYTPEPSNGFSPIRDGQVIKYEIEPPRQWYIQQHPSAATYRHIQTFDPPLPSSFICYLSIGYDALVAYKFEQERRLHPERFTNQIKNQVMYVKHGFTEFFKPSEPITDDIDVFIDGERVTLPQQCRSLKLININSAMNGCFFWGQGKSRDFEYQQQHPPRLDDGKIEVMATRGVHDMLQYRVNLSHAQRISQTNDVVIRFKHIPSTGVAFQIDGEAWIIREKCTIQIQLHDKLPVVIGYNQPRGVQSWLQASLDDEHIVKAKESFRQRLRRKYKVDEQDESSNTEENTTNTNNNSTTNGNNEYESESPQSSPAPSNMVSDDDKDKTIVDKLLDQSSSSFMNMFNIKKPSTTPPKSEVELKEFHLADVDEHKEEKQAQTTEYKLDTKDYTVPPRKTITPHSSNESNSSSNSLKDVFNEMFKPNRNKKQSTPPKTDQSGDIDEEECIPEVDMEEYLRKNPNDKSNILQSSVFSPKTNHHHKQDGIFLDRFTWWKVTRAKNHDKAIDAEAAHDAITNDEHDNTVLRKSQSYQVLPRKGRSASLF